MPHELIPIAIIVTGGLLSFITITGFFATRLGKMKMQMQMAQMKQAGPNEGEIARLETELQQTREELRLLAERQQFVEQLLEKRSDTVSLPK